MPKLIHRSIQGNMLFAAIMSRITRSPQLTNEFSGNNFWCYLFSRLPQFPFRAMSSFEMTSAVLPVRFVCPHARITLNIRTIYCSLGTHNGMRKTNIAFRPTSSGTPLTPFPPDCIYSCMYNVCTYMYVIFPCAKPLLQKRRFLYRSCMFIHLFPVEPFARHKNNQESYK